MSFTKFIFSFTLNIFRTMLFCFCYWIWTGKYRLESLRKILVLFSDLHYSEWRFFLYFNLRKHPLEVFCKKGVLKNFADFTGKHWCWSLVLLKRDSNTGVFLENLRSFQEHLFWRTTANDRLWISRGYYTLPWNDFKETYNWKTNFQDGKEYNRKQYFEW